MSQHLIWNGKVYFIYQSLNLQFPFVGENEKGSAEGTLKIIEFSESDLDDIQVSIYLSIQNVICNKGD